MGRINHAASKVMKEVILPKINEDVNSGKNFATLRQIYNSYILAVWFKQKFKDSFYQCYFNQNKIKGIDLSDKDAREKIYSLYVEAFKKGLYNYTKSEYDQRIRKNLKRQYFSGGSALGNTVHLLRRYPPPYGLPKLEAGKNFGLKITASPLTKDSPQIIDPSVLLQEATLDALPENIKGRRVLVNLDINVPAKDSHILNSKDNPHQRIIAAAETLKELAEKGAIVVAMFHQGRFGEDDFMDRPEEHAAQLSWVMGRPVKTVDDLFGEKAIEEISGLRPGDILLLKPVRAIDSSTGKTLEESPYFVPTLRPLFDYFVAEDFSKRHRETNSVVGFSDLPALIGRSMQKEIEGAEEILHLKRPNLLVVGGGKIEEKLQEVQVSLKENKTDYVLIGGKLSILFLIAAQKEAATASSNDSRHQLAIKTVGKTTADDLKEYLSKLPDLNQLITNYRAKISLPVDMVYLDENDQRKEVVLENGRVREGFNYLLKGIGPQTAQIFSQIISSRTKPFQSAMVVGPLSDSRIDSFLPEIKGVFSAVSQIPFWTTRGGDTIDLINKLRFTPSFVSLAGGASVEYNLKKGNLAGIRFLIANRISKEVPLTPVNDPDAPGPHTLNSPQDLEAVKEMAFNLLRKNGPKGISVSGLEDSRIALFNFAYSAEKVLEELASSKWTVKKVTDNGETRYFYRPFRLFTQANEQTNMQLLEDVVDGALGGHSESKEAHGLGNEKVNAILKQAHNLLGKMNVLALGEPVTMRYPKGDAQEGKLRPEGWEFLEKQVREGLAGLAEAEILNTIFAYEPIWAIGEKAIRAATKEEAQEVHGFIRGILKEIIPGKENQVIIQYGGSMSADNNLAANLMNQNDVDGGLIGGASLTKKKALALIKMVVETVRKQKEAGTFNGRIPVLGFNLKAEIGGPKMEASYLQELMDIFKFIQENLSDIDLEEDIRIFFAVSQTDIPLFNRALMGENPLDLLDLSRATLPNGIELAVSIKELSSFKPGAHTSDLTAEALKLAGVKIVVIGPEVDEATDRRVDRAETVGLKIVKQGGERLLFLEIT